MTKIHLNIAAFTKAQAIIDFYPTLGSCEVTPYIVNYIGAAVGSGDIISAGTWDNHSVDAFINTAFGGAAGKTFLGMKVYPTLRARPFAFDGTRKHFGRKIVNFTSTANKILAATNSPDSETANTFVSLGLWTPSLVSVGANTDYDYILRYHFEFIIDSNPTPRDSLV